MVIVTLGLAHLSHLLLAALVAGSVSPLTFAKHSDAGTCQPLFLPTRAHLLLSLLFRLSVHCLEDKPSLESLCTCPLCMSTTTLRRHANHRPRKRSVSEKESPTFAVSIPTPKKLEFSVPSTPSPTAHSPHALRKAFPAPYGRKSCLDKTGRRYYARNHNMGL
jgi:hypothetical protein